MKTLHSAFALVSLLLLPPVTFAGDEKEKLSGVQIVEKHIAAIGGKAAISKFRSRVAIGTAKKDNDTAVPVAIMSEPSRLSAVYQFEGFNWYLIYNGTTPNVRPPLTRAAAVITHKYEEMLATGTLFNDISLCNLLNLSDASQLKLEAKGTKKVKNRQAHVVEMKPDKGPTLRLYFDVEDFMWLRTDYGTVQITKSLGTFTNSVTSKDEETTFDFYVETSRFKDVDGVKLPFVVEIVATAPILRQKSVGTIVTTISEYRHDISIDPKMFQ